MLLITLILFFIFPKLTFAQIKIVNYQAIGLPEWVEIKNIGSSAQIIDNWFLSDLKGHQLLLSGSIDADATRRFEHQSYWLNDDGDTINLVNDIGTTVDQLVYPTPTSPPTGGPTETPLPTETPIQPGPTETPLPISTPEPTNTPNLPPILSNIYINEFMPNPETGSEWVEIYNNNDFDLSLENWRIQDNTDKQRIIANNTIPSYSYFIFMFNNYLNNTGDSIRLLDQYNRQIGETFTYNTTKKGYSFSLQEDQTWCQTVSSMNQDNFSCYSPPTSTPNPTDTPKPTSTPKNTPTPKKTPTPKYQLPSLSLKK